MAGSASSTGRLIGSDDETIIVNDEPRALGTAATLASLAAGLGFADRKGIAMAVNGGVVPRATWPTHTLNNGDRVLVIRATQGG